MDATQPTATGTTQFRAETAQLLNILIHSLYSEREVFLRELISNASDALTRMDYVLLTDRSVLEPERELAIRIRVDESEHTLSIEDSGDGMTVEEMHANLGTIAHSGAKAFLQAAKDQQGNLSNIIGQFGVGFYSAFMVAEWIRVTSRSYRLDAQAATWYATGSDTYTVEPAERSQRGTQVVIKLKEDAYEFASEPRVREIIHKHSDYIPYPIYVGSDEQPANKQTALWRQTPRQVEAAQYDEFYRQLTHDPRPALAHAHMAVDAPVQVYALLYLPADPEKNIFSLRQQPGLKLYARKVLIQEYCTDLLPEYLQFVEGVVDSEDLPLNVSRETVQSNRVMPQLRKLITGKVIDMLKALGKDKPQEYETFWKGFQRFIKQGVATDAEYSEALLPLLRFHSLKQPADWVGLEDYTLAIPSTQKKIYYILGEDERSLARSPHMEQFRRAGLDVLLLADPLDAFMLLRLNKYKDFELANVTNEKLDAPAEPSTPEEAPAAQPALDGLIAHFKAQLGERVADVRTTDILVDSPARLVDAAGAMGAEYQRVYRLLDKAYEDPKKVLEINPRHPIVERLANQRAEAPVANLIIEQIFENALLVEGLHPDPAAMVERIQALMQSVLDGSAKTQTETSDH